MVDVRGGTARHTPPTFFLSFRNTTQAQMFTKKYIHSTLGTARRHTRLEETRSTCLEIDEVTPDTLGTPEK